MSLTRIATVTLVAAAVFALAVPKSNAEDAAPSGGDKPTYVGDKVCQKCHFAEAKSWKKTPMAKAMESLKPTTEADNKELFAKKTAAKLDPAKDYTTDEKCVKCHTTGAGTDSGFKLDPKTDEEKARATTFGKVSCEACHGPGSLYVKHKTEEVEKNKDAKFAFEALAKFGMVRPDEKTCTQCHNKDNPTAGKEEFKFDDAMKAKVHDHPKK